MNRLTINIKGFDYRLVTESPVEHIRELEGKLNAQVDSLCAKSDVSLQDALVLIALNLMEADNIDITQFSQMREELESLRMHCSRLESIISDLGIHSATDKENPTEAVAEAVLDSENSKVTEPEEASEESLEISDTSDAVAVAVETDTKTVESEQELLVDASVAPEETTHLDGIPLNAVGTDLLTDKPTVATEVLESPEEMDTLSSILDELMRDGDSSMEESSSLLFGENYIQNIDNSTMSNTEVVSQDACQDKVEEITNSYIPDISLENNGDIFKEFNPDNTLEQDMLLQTDNKYIDEISKMLAKATEEADQLRKEVSCIRQKFLY